jgi:predicted RNase H-like nuclease
MYKVIAGVTPCPGGWLIFGGRLTGVTLLADDPVVVRRLGDVLDWRPQFDAAAINVPMAFPDEPTAGFRGCDRSARDLIGWPRRIAVTPVPSRAALEAPSRQAAKEIEPWLQPADLRRFRWLREAAAEFQPFHQRMYFSANPELSFCVLNDDVPLRSSPFSPDGIVERMSLIRERLPGVEELVTQVPPSGAGQYHVLQAAGLLWTARRAAGHAITRMPLDATWDDHGLRVELVR